MDQLLKLLEIMPRVSCPMAESEYIRTSAYRELIKRIGYSPEQAPEREFLHIDTSKNCMP